MELHSQTLNSDCNLYCIFKHCIHQLAWICWNISRWTISFEASILVMPVEKVNHTATNCTYVQNWCKSNKGFITFWLLIAGKYSCSPKTNELWYRTKANKSHASFHTNHGDYFNLIKSARNRISISVALVGVCFCFADWISFLIVIIVISSI